MSFVKSDAWVNCIPFPHIACYLSVGLKQIMDQKGLYLIICDNELTDPFCEGELKLPTY